MGIQYSPCIHNFKVRTYHNPKKNKKTKIGVCTDVKLISNTTVERSRDKLLRLYSNIHGFYLFLHKVQEVHNIPQRNVSDSLPIGTHCTEIQHTPNIPRSIIKISFFFLTAASSQKEIFQKYENRGAL